MTDIGLYSLDDDSVVTFSLKNMERAVAGPEEALQLVAYHLFTKVGTNTFDREEGGGLRSLLNTSLRSKESLRTDATIAISRAMTNIRRTQSEDKAANATVVNLQLLDLRVLRETLEIAVTIRIDLLDGNSFQATFRVS